MYHFGDFLDQTYFSSCYERAQIFRIQKRSLLGPYTKYRRQKRQCHLLSSSRQVLCFSPYYHALLKCIVMIRTYNQLSVRPSSLNFLFRIWRTLIPAPSAPSVTSRKSSPRGSAATFACSF